MSNIRKFGLFSFWIVLLVITGCRIIPSLWTFDSDEQNASQIVQLLNKNLNKSDELKFSLNGFELNFPQNTLPENCQLSITNKPAYSLQLPKTNQFSQISSIYSIETNPSFERLNLSAKLIIPINQLNKSELDTIFTACRYNSGEWAFLTPIISSSSNYLTQNINHFSDWLVVKRTVQNKLEPTQAPLLTASPSKIIASNSGLIDENLQLASFIEIDGAESLSLTNYQFKLIIYDPERKGISLIHPQDPTIKETFTSNNDGIIEIDLINSSFANIDLSFNKATSTVFLNFKNTELATVYEKLKWKLILKSASDINYEADGIIEFLPATKETLAPRVISTTPYDGQNDFSPTSPITITFNSEMNKQTVENSISLNSSSQNLSYNWITNNSVQIFSNVPLELNTQYELKLATSSTNLGGYKFAEPFVLNFKTSKVSDINSPEITSIFPNETTRFLKNSQLAISFSEPININSLPTALTWLSPSDYQANYRWENNQSRLIISPTSNWTENKLYSLKISNELSDLAQNKLKVEKIIEFTPENAYGPELLTVEPQPNYPIYSETSQIKLRFSEAINPTTLFHSLISNIDSFKVASISWANSDTEANIYLETPLIENSIYQLELSTSIQSAKGISIAGNRFFQLVTSDFSQPTILSISPATGSTNLANNICPQIKFSEPMNAASVENSLKIIPESIQYSLSWTENNSKLAISPQPAWPSQQVAFQILPTARDIFGNSLASSTFFHLAFTNIQAPQILAITPADNSIRISSQASILIQFNQSMDQTSVAQAFTIQPNENGTISWSSNNKEFSFTPSNGFKENTSYSIKVTTDALSESGINLIKEMAATFQTIDTTPPALISIFPSDKAIKVSPDTNLEFIFTESIATSTFASSLKISPALADNSISLNWSQDFSKVSVSYNSAFQQLTTYTVTLDTNVQDLEKNNLEQILRFSFVTGDSSPPNILSFIPQNNQTIPANGEIEIKFTESVATSTFKFEITPQPSGQSILNWDQNQTQVSISYSIPFALSSTYNVAILPGLQDIYSNATTQNYNYNFQTNSSKYPSILNLLPENNANKVSISTDITIYFDSPMDQNLTEQAFNIVPAATATFIWNSTSDKLTASLTEHLKFSTDYSIEILKSAKASNGLNLAKTIISNFKTEAQPQIISELVQPAPHSIDIASNTSVQIVFSHEMDKDRTEAAFSLVDSSNKNISGNFKWIGDRLIFTPSANLTPNTEFKILINKNATDLRGYSIKEEWLSSFKTQTGPNPEILSYLPANNSTNNNFDSPIKIEFNTRIDTSTLSISFSPAISSSFTDTWSADGKTLTRNYFSGLASNETYTVTIGSTTTNIYGVSLATPLTFNFTTLPSAAPRLLESTPNPGSTNISISSNLEFTFSEAMKKVETQSAFTITPSIVGSHTFSWSNEGKTLTINPENDLAFATIYEITFSTIAQSISGNNLAANISSNFTTTTQPQIISTSPASGATNIALTDDISIEFNKPMNQSSVENAIAITSDGTPIAFNSSWADNKLLINPDADFQNSKTIKIALSQTAKDLLDNNLSDNFIFQFNTIPAESPQIESFVPLNGNTNIAYNSTIQVQFSLPMATESVSVSFTPNIAGTHISNWSPDNKTLTITPGSNFLSDTTYTVNIDSASKSQSGTNISGQTNFSFTSEPITGAIVTQLIPASGTTSFPVNSAISVKFNKGIDRSSFEQHFAISPTPSGTKSINWSTDNKLATISFSAPLSFLTLYTINISQNTLDYQGFKLQSSFSANFRTELPPLVASFSIPDNAQNIATSTPLIITFNKMMDINSTQNAVQLLRGASIVNCNYSWNQNKLSCIPVAQLQPNSSYTILVNTSAKDTNGNSLESYFSSSFETVESPEFKVLSVSPFSGQTNIPVNTNINVSFSTPVNKTSLAISFSPSLPGSPSLSWVNGDKQLTITPGGNLSGNQLYTITIGTTTKDIYQKSLTNSFISTFTTEILAGPSITSTQPAPGSYEIPLSQNFSFTFDRAMKQTETQNAYEISPTPVAPPSFSWSPDLKTLNISYSENLIHDTSYLIKVKNTAEDLSGLKMAQDYLLPFITVKRPEVIANSVFPISNAINVATSTQIKIEFSKEMDKTSVESALSLKESGITIAGNYSWQNNEVTFTPASPLNYNSTYQINLTSSAKDTQGNFIEAPFNSIFTTIGREAEIWRRDQSKTYDSSTFSPRQNHQMISYNNYLWVIGGDDGQLLNDVWRSSDGVSWTKELASTSTPLSTQFSPRAGHSCLVFDNKLWLTGGYSQNESGIEYLDDVWWTTNGRTWNLATATANFYSRAFHSMQIFQNKMWIFAGETLDQDDNRLYLDDTWYSTDGINWTLQNNIVSYFPRFRTCSGVIDDKLFIWGGYGKKSEGTVQALNDIWYTTNGSVWLLHSQAAPFSERCSMGSLKYKDKYWIIGGSDNFSVQTLNFKNDIWSSSDGFNWSLVLQDENESGTHFSRRSFIQAAELNNRIFISGGESETGFTNEVWSAQ